MRLRRTTPIGRSLKYRFNHNPIHFSGKPGGTRMLVFTFVPSGVDFLAKPHEPWGASLPILLSEVAIPA